MVEAPKEKKTLTGQGLLPPPAQVGHEGKTFALWTLGKEARFRPLDHEAIFQVVGVTLSDVHAVSEQESWAFEHETPVHLILI